jgi:hypothetical protein
VRRFSVAFWLLRFSFLDMGGFVMALVFFVCDVMMWGIDWQ